MKQLFVLVVCAAILSGFLGCQNADNTVQVTVEGGGQFPQFLVGTWKDDKYGWEFVFEPDGTISSAVIDVGKIRVTPSKRITTARLKGRGESVYKLGQWTVQYSPSVRELAVEVVVEYYRLTLDKQGRGLTGHSTDWFVGPVSEDSQRWEAEWFTFQKNILLSPEPSEFPFDPNDNPIDVLVFRKQQKTG